MSDRAEVFIYLLREDQRVKFVMRSHPEEIRAKMRKFRSVLSNATDAIVNVDHFKVHENHDGSIDKTKTDVLLHFVNPLDNTIMEVQDVIRTLDYRTEELDPFFKEFNVLQTEGADPLFSAQKQHSTEMVLVLWLAGVTAFLSITLIVVLCVCFSQRQRYSRALKAATTAAYGARAGETGGKDVVPNTNRHATEGSNPVWMTGAGYDNWAAEHEEENDDEMSDDQPPRYDNFDSLDANVLNDSYEDKVNHERMERLDEEGEEEERVPEHLRGDVMYAPSHHSGGGSTLRITARKTHSPDSDSSSSSGRGSGSRLGSGFDPSAQFGSINRNLSALFPAGMPPVERLQPNHCNPLATSSNPLSKALSTSSMADLREGLPRTEL